MKNRYGKRIAGIICALAMLFSSLNNTVTKQVGGTLGNRTKEFTFDLEIEDAGEGEGFVWAKNGELQPPMPRTGGSFTMKHNDRIEIELPQGVRVRLTEDTDGYKTTIRLGNESAESVSTKAFTFTGSTSLLVTNTLDGVVKTGVSSSLRQSYALVVIPVSVIGLVLYSKRKRRKNA